MPLLYPYADAYLAPLVSPAREDQAVSDVAAMGTFPDDWKQRLVVLQTYIITCTESMRSSDDVFNAKLSAYRAMLRDALPQARAAQKVVDDAAGLAPTGGGSVFSVSLERA